MDVHPLLFKIRPPGLQFRIGTLLQNPNPILSQPRIRFRVFYLPFNDLKLAENYQSRLNVTLFIYTVVTATFKFQFEEILYFRRYKSVSFRQAFRISRVRSPRLRRANTWWCYSVGNLRPVQRAGRHHAARCELLHGLLPALRQPQQARTQVQLILHFVGILFGKNERAPTFANNLKFIIASVFTTWNWFFYCVLYLKLIFATGFFFFYVYYLK